VPWSRRLYEVVGRLLDTVVGDGSPPGVAAQQQAARESLREAAAQRAGLPTMVWYNYRRVPAVSLAKRIVAGLPDLLRRDGFADLASAVGSDAG